MALKEILEKEVKFPFYAQFSLGSPSSFRINLSLLCNCGNVYKQKEKFNFDVVESNSSDCKDYIAKRQSKCPDCKEKSLLEFHLRAETTLDEDDCLTLIYNVAGQALII